ncbi:long-chain-alcohol oxidase FAO4A-like [Diospyros lotus]|uniref:long-chain-alcohol oxidase FAO4A-like n=1 Tax=Diospyros lotus TaxID=55363 RepID=UPI00225B6895|nr:long-chain-alcohol oxidase FAO4A-like [Diospyros lotus]
MQISSHRQHLFCSTMEQNSAAANGFIEGVAVVSCGAGEGRRTRGSSLSGGQMESLAALCDTFFPAVNISGDTSDDYVAAYYRTSASMAGTPQGVAEMITQRLQHPKLVLFRLAIWLLSTCFGTLILCGRKSLSSHFPYLQRFAKVRAEKREEIVKSWSLSFISHLRMLFFAFKILTLLVFFTQVDDNGENLSWKAIGYCGPDPDFMKTVTRKCRTSKETGFLRSDDPENEDLVRKEPIYGPLTDSLIHLNSNPRQLVVESLRRLGCPAAILDGKTNPGPSLIVKCDAVVVGSGSGGSVVAGVLAKAGYKVLVLEKGNYFARANLSLLEGPTMNHMYMGNGLLATDDAGVVILAGETVGGGSTINWSASISTPKHVCKEWCEEYGLELFESKLYREAMEVVCERMGVQSEVENEGFNNAVLRRGCEELGYPVNNIPRNSAANHCCGWCGLGCKDGRKKGGAETWLVDLVDSGNGAVLPGCEAVKVLTRRRKGRDRSIATGVAFEFQYNGERKETCIVESKITIVAAGALSTPPLLKRSGLKNGNIGRNLHLHPVTMAWGHFPETNPWPEPDKRSYEGGIMTAMSTVVADFDKSGYGAVIQTPSLHPGMFSIVMPWISGTDMKTRMCRFSRTAHIFALARDKGSGKVISPNSISYQMDNIDEENLQKGLEKVLRILTAAGAKEIGTHHRSGERLRVKEVSSNEFERFVKKESSRPLKDLLTPICSAHQMGSCRMGSEPRWSAVNQNGETWEVQGLFVADSSVFPTSLGVNPMVTVQAIAYCTAQTVLEVLSRKKSK